MKINREDVVQAALKVERWCKYHEMAGGDCDCPFVVENAYISKLCVLGGWQSENLVFGKAF